MNRVFAGVAVATMLLVPALAEAQQKKTSQPEGVKSLTTLSPKEGFADDAFVFDGSGGRFAWVRTDASTFAEIQVLDLTQGAQAFATIDVSKTTVSIVKLAFTSEGNVLALARPADDLDGNATAYLFDLKGKMVRKWGPATDIAFVNVNGTDAVTVWNRKVDKKGNTTYDIAIFRADNGKPVAKKRQLKADANGKIKSLAMTLLYWRNGYTQLVGQKKGDYDKYEDQRQPDNEGVYDVVDGAIVKNQPITDLMAHQALVKLREQHWNEAMFLVVSQDSKGLDLVTPDEKVVRVETPEPFSHYDAKTLVYETAADGKIYFTLTIDPVNPDAVARKVADPERIDLYVTDAAGGKATRLARLPKGDRPFAWHVAGGRWAMLRKHKGYDRGGADLEVYDLVK